MMQTDVKSTNVTATGTVVATARSRIKGVWLVASAAGTVVLRDGGGSGTTILTLNTQGAGTFMMPLPGEGILFATDLHATLTSVSSLTVFWG